MARPSPRAAPVTMATRPAKSCVGGVVMGAALLESCEYVAASEEQQPSAFGVSE